MSIWESERYDWSTIEAAAGRSGHAIPDALESLRTATTEDEAREAYWRIDNTVVVQGSLFDAALPTAACIVNMLSASASGPSRVRLIELLEQISDGETPSGREELRARIRNEVRRGFGIYAGLLQYGVEMERELCVDLLVFCAHGDPELSDRSRFYLQQLALDAGASRRVREYAQGRLSDISTTNR